MERCLIVRDIVLISYMWQKVNMASRIAMVPEMIKLKEGEKRVKKIEFEIKDSDFVSLGNAAHNTKVSRDIEPEKFIEIYKKITKKYRFQITQDFYQKFKEEMWGFGKKQYFQINILKYIIDFFIQCNTLLENEIEISPLISEFRGSGDIYELRHSCSLSYLTSVYASNDYKIEFLGKSNSTSPDFSINGISADLKVIQMTDWGKVHMEKGKKEFKTDLSDDIAYDLGTFIRNRLSEGAKQADMLFVDLTNKSSLMLYLNEKFDQNSDIIPEPKKYRVIYFWRAGPNKFIGRKGIYSFFGTFVDFDINLWNYIKNNNTTITHRMGP